MLFKGSHPPVLSRPRVLLNLHCASLLCWIHPLPVKSECISPAVVYSCRGHCSYILHVKHLFWPMLSQSSRPDTTPVVWNIQSLGNHQNEWKHAPARNTQLPHAKRCISVPAGERDSSQGVSSVASAIQDQNSTPSSWQNNSRITDITQPVASTLSTTPWRSVCTPTATPGTTVLAHQHPEEPHTQTQHVTLYPAPHLALLALPLFSAVLKASLPWSLILKPALL